MLDYPRYDKRADRSYLGVYIAQAESLSPNDDYIRTAKAHLLLKGASEIDGYAESADLWKEGESLINEQIEVARKLQISLCQFQRSESFYPLLLGFLRPED
jgi:hypothetical protein